MLKLINKTNKTDFRIQVENRGIVTNPTEAENPAWRAWSLTDKTGEQWKIQFTNKVGEFFVESVHANQPPVYRLWLYFKGQEVRIYNLMKNRRIYQNERYLRKYSNLAILINNLVVYNYIKL
jgi:hypothetical protein